MGRKIFLAALASLILAGGVGVWLWTGSRSGATVRPNIVQLQQLAIKSCRCVGRGDLEDECWADYRTSIANFEVESLASACAPISTTIDCFPTASEECVVVDYGYDGVCTEGEARAIELVWNEALEGVNQDDEVAVRNAYTQANAATAALIERIKRGERVSAPPSEGGCV